MSLRILKFEQLKGNDYMNDYCSRIITCGAESSLWTVEFGIVDLNRDVVVLECQMGGLITFMIRACNVTQSFY